MKPYTIALAGLSLSLVVASWGSKKDGESRRDVIAMAVFSLASIVATVATLFVA